jgi:ankyrin repeat protein
MPKPSAPFLVHALVPVGLLMGMVVLWRVQGDANTAQSQAVNPNRVLVQAVEEGDAAKVADLLNAGANPNAARPVYRPIGAKNERERFAPTPLLSIAVGNRNVALSRLLIERGANVNARGRFGYTALHTAATVGDGQCARLLLQAGADVHATETIRKQTPLTRARFALKVAQRQHATQAELARRAELVRLLQSANLTSRRVVNLQTGG